jgi:hypothetical protein
LDFHYQTIQKLSNINNKFSEKVNDISAHIDLESDQMIASIIQIGEDQIKLNNLSYKTNITDYITNIYNYDNIKNESLNYANMTKNFVTIFGDAENSRHQYQIASIILIPLLTIIALLGYGIKRSWIILIMSILLFALIIPACVILGLNTSYFILSIDFCKDINKYIQTGVNPYAERGIGVYISCPTKNTQVMISTAMYELGNSFNKVIKELNQTMNSTYKSNLGVYKRNNTHFKQLADVTFSNDTNIQKGLYSLYYTNNILTELNNLSRCKLAQDSINYIEQNFCYMNITLQFSNLIFYLIGIFGLFLVSVGTNKLIVMLNPAYLKLRTKKGIELVDESY